MGELFDLEVAPAEQEAREPEEAGVAARDEHACPRLVVLVVERIGAGAALRARVRRAARRPRDAVAHLETATTRLSGGELDDLARSAARDRAPGADVVLDLDDHLVGVEEDRVDRKAHERGVDAPAGPEHHAFALPQVLAAEKAAHPPMRTVGDDDALADDPAVLPAERQRGHRPPLGEARRRC